MKEIHFPINFSKEFYSGGSRRDCKFPNEINNLSIIFRQACSFVSPSAEMPYLGLLKISRLAWGIVICFSTYLASAGVSTANVLSGSCSKYLIFVAEKVDFSTSLDKITVFPNPYYVDDRNWPGRISFTNLPRETTIKIYTVAGKVIKTIKHWDTADGGSEEWDVSGIAGGIYMYTIISPEGTRKGKVSIIK